LLVEMDNDLIYRGPWINWSHGAIKGATLTISERDGGLLISFIATFITVVGAQLWRILSFALHQIRSTDAPRDGLHHQQQNILRNTSTPAGTAWTYLQQAWYWRGRARSVLLRTLPMSLFGFLYLVLFGVLATFSSQISKSAGPARLIYGNNCGYWRLDPDVDPRSPAAQSANNQRLANETIITSSYARACYGDKPDRLSCGTYPVSALKYTTESNATCPFANGMCVGGDTAAVKLTTTRINTHYDLGINAPSRHRIEVVKESTCSPLVQLRAPINGTEEGGDAGNLYLDYYYGGIGDLNYTYRFNTMVMKTQSPYQVNTIQSTAPHENDGRGWQPIEDLAVKNADVSMVFVAANNMRFTAPVDDPVFGAHYVFETEFGTFYESDEYNVAIACAETYKICDPSTNKCSDPVGILQLSDTALSSLDLNGFQTALVARTGMPLMLSSVYSQVTARTGSSALRASDTAAGLEQQPLPANQWERECAAWFQTGLARLQYGVQEYATGPNVVPEGSHVWKPGEGDDADLNQLAMCYSQVVNDTSGTTSFSILGLIIVFVIGGVILLTSFILDTLVALIQTLTRRGLAKKRAWSQDDKLQLQRRVFELAGTGDWCDRHGFPVTVSASDIPRADAAYSQTSTMVQHKPGEHHGINLNGGGSEGSSGPAAAAPMYFPPPPPTNAQTQSYVGGLDTVAQKDSDVVVREVLR
jgi:hypothetical protein